MEELARRTLRARGPLTRRDLRRNTHADRYGLSVLETAVRNLLSSGDLRFEKTSRTYALGAEVQADG